MNKIPEMQYGEAPDMTVYQRKEGDRLLVFVQDGWNDSLVIYNTIRQYHADNYIDFVVISDRTKFVEGICKSQNISFIDYTENSFHEILDNARPTKAILFYKDNDTIVNEWWYLLETNHIPFRIFR